MKVQGPDTDHLIEQASQGDGAARQKLLTRNRRSRRVTSAPWSGCGPSARNSARTTHEHPHAIQVGRIANPSYLARKTDEHTHAIRVGRIANPSSPARTTDEHIHTIAEP
jgi:hypothetical protein